MNLREKRGFGTIIGAPRFMENVRCIAVSRFSDVASIANAEHTDVNLQYALKGDRSRSR